MMDILVGEGTFFMNNQKQEMVAQLRYYIDEQGRIVVTSTFVDPSLRGQGIANQLMAKVIHKATLEKRLIIPLCSFALKVLSQPAYGHLIDPNWRA